METSPPAPPVVTRKAYQTDCRPLADVVFFVGMIVAMLLAEDLKPIENVPAATTFAALGPIAAVLYALWTNTLTVFRVSLPNLLLTALIVFGLSLLVIASEPKAGLDSHMAMMPFYTSTTSQLVQEAFRRLRRG